MTPNTRPGTAPDLYRSISMDDGFTISLTTDDEDGTYRVAGAPVEEVHGDAAFALRDYAAICRSTAKLLEDTADEVADSARQGTESWEDADEIEAMARKAIARDAVAFRDEADDADTEADSHNGSTPSTPFGAAEGKP